ncbi:MAG: tetratricopeptide repeat protein [Dehalococcoidia bacterium]
MAAAPVSNAGQHYNAGAELAEQGRLAEAIAEYNEALRLDPQLALTYNNRGEAYRNLCQYQRAIQDYEEALRLDSQLCPWPTTTGANPTIT